MTRLSMSRRAQRGTTLIEALAAFVVLTLGMLALARTQPALRQHAELARQRSEAVRLAQAEIESLRAFASLGAAPGQPSFDAIANDTRVVDASGQAAVQGAYTLTRAIDAGAIANAKQALVTVAWTDRAGAAQQVALAAIVAANPPALGGALGLARPAGAAPGAFGRSARIPVAAKDLGDGRSVFKPRGDGTLAFVFDNRSAAITARCDAVDPATPTAALTLANLGACNTSAGLLLSGTVRFTAAQPPDAAHANDAPLAFAIALTLTGATYPAAPVCGVDLAAWTSAGDRYATYHCVVYPASGPWSGRANLAPSGWTIGSAATDRRVCRYAADLDASGAIDANLEHPADYANVGAALTNQNFVVVAGSAACPGGAAVQIAGNNTDVDADFGTAPHQP
ncbi:MAG TPA: hypothetical protein VNU71_00940 [Burkholderiaceae bacterium]|nr:hypothetical protein [Burkholderiaceae bacterium]